MPEIVDTQEQARNMAADIDMLRKAAPHRCTDGWTCEQHIMEAFGHEIDGVVCAGPGEPCPNAGGPGFAACPSNIEPYVLVRIWNRLAWRLWRRASRNKWMSAG